MNCKHARNLFAAFWDDETTQAEREWLEGHFTSCPACRREYEQYARTLELVGSLPRVEAAADLSDRVLQRVRRAETVPDTMPVRRPIWVPVGSAVAACALLALTLANPWSGGPRDPRTAQRSTDPVTQPVLVEPPLSAESSPVAAAIEVPAATTDSLFDHS
jgi:anti-sigma factor RsiW